MWPQRRGRRLRPPPPGVLDEDEHNYEDASRNLTSNSFRWLFTANARADMQLKIAETSLTKERNRVRNAIERQQKSLQSRSVVLQSKLRISPPRKFPEKKTVGGSTPDLKRPRCPTPNASIPIILTRAPSSHLPRITCDVFDKQEDSLRSFFSRHVTDTGKERRHSKQRGHCSMRLSVDSATDQQEEKMTKDYLQVPLRRSKNRTHSL